MGFLGHSAVFTGSKNNWLEQTGSRWNIRWTYLTFMHDCTHVCERQSVRVCSYGFVVNVMRMCLVDMFSGESQMTLP